MSGSALPSSDDDDKVSDFNEEKCKRIMAEAARLAALAPVEWRIWIDASAEELHIPRDTLETLIDDIITANEKAAKEKAAADRRSSQMAERAHKAEAKKKERDEAKKQKADDKEATDKAKLKAKAFATIQRLPVADRDARLQKLAAQLGEDIDALRAQFAEYVDSVTAPSMMSAWDIEPWGEPVETAALLLDLTVKIQKHVVMTPHQAVAVALWVMFAWIHDVAAAYSPYLVATSADAGEGKSTLTHDVVGRLAPRPLLVGEPNAPNVFRLADEHKPTLLVDDVDTLFERKPELTSIFKIGYKRGPKIPRQERIGGVSVTRWFDPFTPKGCNLIGTDIPNPLHTRCILVRLRRIKASETIVKPTDDDEFATLCRKLKRWSDDNAPTLKDAPSSPDFINRESDNWHLQLAIAQLAGGEWPARALYAARDLTRKMHKPSWRQILINDFRRAFRSNRRKYVGSEEFHRAVLADPLSPWLEYNRGGKATQRQFAHLLKDFEIYPKLVGDSRLRGYVAVDFADVFERYPDEGGDPLILSQTTEPKSKPKSKRKSKAKPKRKSAPKPKKKKRG